MIDIEEIAKLIGPAIDKLEPERQNVVRRQRNYAELMKALAVPAFVGVCGLLFLTAASFFYNSTQGSRSVFTQSTLFLIIVLGSLGLFVFTLAVYVLIPHYNLIRTAFGYRNPELSLRNTIRQDVVAPLLAHLAPAYTYEGMGHMALREYFDMGNLNLRGRNYIKGKLHTREFELCDLEIRLKLEDSNEVLNDLVMVIKSPELDCKPIFIANKRKLEDIGYYAHIFDAGAKVHFNDPLFEETYVVRAPSYSSAESLLNETLRKRLVAFANAHPSINIIYYKKGLLFAAFKTRNDLFDINLNRRLIPFDIAWDMCSELENTLSLVTDTNLMLPALSRERTKA